MQTPEDFLSITSELNIVPPCIKRLVLYKILETNTTGLNGVLSIFGAVFLFC